MKTRITLVAAVVAVAAAVAAGFAVAGSRDDHEQPITGTALARASEAALGRQATQRLVQLMNDGPFELVHRSGRDEDRYGRKLRVVERRGRSVGDTLIAEGLARRWDGARRSWCG